MTVISDHNWGRLGSGLRVSGHGVVEARSEVNAKDNKPQAWRSLASETSRSQHDLFLDCHSHSTPCSARSFRDSIMSSLDGTVINTLVTLETDFLGLRRQWRRNTRVPCFQSWLEAARLPEEMRLSSFPLICPPAEEAPSLGTGNLLEACHW